MEDFEKLFNTLSDKEQELFIKYRYGYVYSKAKLFLEIGAVEYVKKDFFEMDISDLDDDDFEILNDGCKQILSGRGLSAEKPFENLDVSGFTKLFEIFHFNVSRIETLRPDPMKFLDWMSVVHIIDDYKAEYYNLVEY